MKKKKKNTHIKHRPSFLFVGEKSQQCDLLVLKNVCVGDSLFFFFIFVWKRDLQGAKVLQVQGSAKVKDSYYNRVVGSSDKTRLHVNSSAPKNIMRREPSHVNVSVCCSAGRRACTALRTLIDEKRHGTRSRDIHRTSGQRR